MQKKIVLEFNSEEEFRDYEKKLMDIGVMANHGAMMSLINDMLTRDLKDATVVAMLMAWTQAGGDTVDDLLATLSMH